MTLHALHGPDEVIESIPRAPVQRAGFAVDSWAAGSQSLGPPTTVFARAEAELSEAATGQQEATTAPTNKYPSHVRVLSWLHYSWTYNNDRIIPKI